MIDNSLVLALLLLLSLMVTFILTPRYISLIEGDNNVFMATNYEGKKIVTAGGIVFLPAVLLTAYYYYHTSGSIYDAILFLLFLAGMLLMGLVDDLQGDKNHKGFRGHLGLLLREKKVSTGLVKAGGGFILAMLVAAGTGVTSNMDWLAKGIFIALFANLFNLLDTRPAMAIKAFYLISIIFILFGIVEFIFLIFWASLYVYLPWELSRKIMLGDTGAYLLGSIIAYFAVVSFSSLLLYIVLFFLFALHMLLEKYSISKIISDKTLQFTLQQVSLLKRRGE